MSGNGLISRDEARRIADNPDGCTVEEVRALAQYIGSGVRPLPQAASLWPNLEVEGIPGYKSEAPVGRLHVAKTIRAYCWNKATAMELRAKGNIERALEYERICERVYGELPQWARW